MLSVKGASTRVLVALLLVLAVVTCPLECLHSCTNAAAAEPEASAGSEHGHAGSHHGNEHPHSKRAADHDNDSGCEDCSSFFVGLTRSDDGPSAVADSVRCILREPRFVAFDFASRLPAPPDDATQTGGPPVYLAVCSLLI